MERPHVDVAQTPSRKRVPVLMPEIAFQSRAPEAWAGLVEARWTLLNPTARSMLRRELERLLQEGWSLGRCRLRRVKLKPGRKLSAYYDAELCAAGGTLLRSRAIAVAWGPQPFPPLNPYATADEAKAIEREPRPPFSGLHADVPEWGARIVVSPFDQSYPQLVQLSDPSYAGTVTPGTSGRAPTVSTIRYRPGQRHVLRYDFPADGTSCTRTVYAKLYSGGLDHPAFALAKEAAEWLQHAGSEAAAARPLAHLQGDGAVLWESLPGRPLSRLPKRLNASGGLLLRRAGALLARLHRAPIDLGGELASRTLDSELQATLRASEHITALLPSVGIDICKLVEHARDAYGRLQQQSPTFVHGDFKLDHLWGEFGGVTVMDLDSARQADPALDVGKLHADLRWQPIAGLSAASAQAEFLRGYAAEPATELLARARVWEAVWLVKIAARRVPIIDSLWQQRVENLVERAGLLLESSQSQLDRH